MHLEFGCARRYVMALTLGYAMALHRLVLVINQITPKLHSTYMSGVLPYFQVQAKCYHY